MSKLEINSVRDKGKLETECLWLHAAEDIPNLGEYVVCDSTYGGDGRISNELRHTYWLPRIAVKKGDWVQLVTKTGQNNLTKNDKNTTTHTFFWNLGHTVWNKGGDAAVVFKIESMTHKRV